MQTPITFAIGTGGMQIPDHPESIRLLKLILDIPTLNAGTATFATSRDGGSTWQGCLGALALTNAEPTLTAGATVATYAGGHRLIFGPYLPGTKFRVTSSVSQTATINAYVGI